MSHVLGLRYRGLCSDGFVEQNNRELRSLPLDRLAELGVSGLELVLPPDTTADQVRELLEPQGLSVASVETSICLGDDELNSTVAVAASKAALAKKLGATYLFASVKAGELSKREAYDRLRRVGDAVGQHGIFLAMETHPDLCQNADQMLETMAGIDHPFVGINFDTANFYYYNREMDMLADLRRVAPQVRGVHFKDTFGGFKNGNFPVLGEGIVDFAEVESVLEEAVYQGPYVMELEGSVFDYAKQDLLDSQIRSCVDHVRSVCAIQ